jgi:hypothetical protein
MLELHFIIIIIIIIRIYGTTCKAQAEKSADLARESLLERKHILLINQLFIICIIIC